MNPGATVIGLIFKDGVMLAADKRFTYGGFITAKNVKKTFKISDKTGSACAGLVSDMQELMKELTSLIKLKELQINVCGKSMIYLLGTEIKWVEN